MTPDVYEREFHLPAGHATSFAGGPLAALRNDDPELTRYETAVPGLYLTGAATFPGAGVWGASGRNCATVVLAHTAERRRGVSGGSRTRRRSIRRRRRWCRACDGRLHAEHRQQRRCVVSLGTGVAGRSGHRGAVRSVVARGQRYSYSGTPRS